MTHVSYLLGVTFLCMAACIARAAEPDGLLAEWKCDEGKGSVLRDSSGHGHDGTIRGASWTPCGEGYALSFDGVDDYVDFAGAPALERTGPVTAEIWFKPLSCGWGETYLMGNSTSGYCIIFSNRGLAWWFISSGSYTTGGKLVLREWNHIVAAYDGKARRLWINGRLAAYTETATPPGKGGPFLLGSIAPPHFRGLVDSVRLYDRALTGEEALAHYRSEAPSHEFDPAWFKRVKVTPFFYLDEGRIVVELDYNALRPLVGAAKFEVSLSAAGNAAPLQEIVLPIPEGPKSSSRGYVSDLGVLEAALSCSGLAAGEYAIRVKLVDDAPGRSVETVKFAYPPQKQIPSPVERVVGPAPAEAGPTPYTLKMDKAGGFHLLVKDKSYPFETRISWPNGDFNRLSPSDEALKGETSWKPQLRNAGANRYEVTAGGDFYTVHRSVELFPTHIYVKDTYTNKTKSDLGLLIYNETPIPDERVKSARLCGYEGGGRMVEMPHYAGASVFVEEENTGLGMAPMDDVFIIQSILYVEKNTAGMGTQKFALAPEASYTLEWTIYPTGSGDYYDFVNAYRRNEGRIGTLNGGFGFISYGPMNRRQVPDETFMKNRNLTCGIISCLSRSADDPGISIEGIEFMDFPRERELTRQQAQALRAKYPGMKVVFHNAHTLYATNKPERFADSKLVGSDGVHRASGGPPNFSQKRTDEGWLWYVFYPSPGNSFHDWLMKSVDVMMDDMGMDGAFVDGFLLGYGGPWTYDGRWDGHTADMDLQTRTIKRKVGSVLLLMQPSMIEYARKIRDRGGVCIANGAIMTRSVAQERYIVFDAECQAGPECHFAPTLLSLANPPFRSEREIYRDMLDKLRWGVLYMFYNDRIPLTHLTLAAKEFPITFEEIRSGIVRGKERIITMKPGVYEWKDSRALHFIYKFDGRGAPTAHDFVTTVDKAGVRSELNLLKEESAVIEPLPATLESARPVNIRVLQYDDAERRFLLNGQGDAKLEVFVGSGYPDWRDGVFTDGGVNPADVGVGAEYRVVAGNTQTAIKDIDGTLSVPLALNGQVEVIVSRTVGK